MALRADASLSQRVLFLLSVLSALSVWSVPVYPQSRAEGRVVTPDSTPTGGVRVVLHRVGREVQGPLDSIRTNRQGRFRFSFHSDTTSLYLLSARYKGIEYFSPPVHTNPERPDTAIRIIVSDTSSTAPVALEARHLVVTKPGQDGTRSVLDLLVLRNQGDRTRIAPDSLRPSWSGPLPRGTIGLELMEGDVSPDAVSRRGDTIIVTAPLVPGEKQITVQYMVPSDRHTLELPFQDSISSLSVLTEEEDGRVLGGGVVRAGSQSIEGRTFHRWSGAISAGGTLRLVLPSRTAPWRVLAVLMGLVVLGLGAAGWVAMRRGETAHAASTADDLLQAIAALDARYADRQAEITAAEWDAYQRQRAVLKARLESSLAAQRRIP